jgi:hypothetical protein
VIEKQRTYQGVRNRKYKITVFTVITVTHSRAVGSRKHFVHRRRALRESVSVASMTATINELIAEVIASAASGSSSASSRSGVIRTLEC